MRFLVVVLCLLSSAVHLVVGENSYCVAACQNPLQYLKFEAPAGSNETKPQCTNLFDIQSFYVCLREYCTDSQVKDGASSLRKTCKGTTLPPFSIVDNITSATLRQVEYKDLRKKTVIAEVVLLSQRLFDLSVKTLAVTADQDQLNLNYGHAIFGFWGIVILIGVINRVYTIIRRRNESRRSSSSNTTEKRTLARRIQLGVRQHVTTPALFKEHSATPVGWCTIPPRLPSLTILSYLILNVVLMLVSYEVFPENVRRPNEAQQLTRFIARRAGVMAVISVPLIFIFATRNNVLIWLTGWNFHTFSQFHRWIARMVVVNLVVHGITYSIYYYKTGGLDEYYGIWENAFVHGGAAALVVACLTTAWAIYPVRRYLYEAFLVVHIVFTIIFLVGMWIHIEKKADEFLPYYWTCVAVWSFDRLMRLVRLLYLNLFTGKAVVKYNPNSELVRLEAPIRLPVRPQAGTYYYVYVLQGLKFWESHPFTLSSWDHTKEDTSSLHTLSFIIQPQDSFTARLRETMVRQSTAEDGSTVHSRSLRVLVEGPYGHPYSLRSYDSALIIVGGSGVTVAVSQLQNLRESLDRNHKMPIRRVHVVWVIRHEAQFQDLLEQEIASWLEPSGLLTEVDVHVDVYVTHKGEITPWAGESSLTQLDLDEKANADSSASSTSGQMTPPTIINDEEKIQSAPTSQAMGDEKSPKALLTASSSRTMMSSHLSHHNHRPSVREIVLENSRVYGCQGKRMAIVCCGPPSMADEVRAAVVTSMHSGADGVHFFPESFTW